MAVLCHAALSAPRMRSSRYVARRARSETRLHQDFDRAGTLRCCRSQDTQRQAPAYARLRRCSRASSRRLASQAAKTSGSRCAAISRSLADARLWWDVVASDIEPVIEDTKVAAAGAALCPKSRGGTKPGRFGRRLSNRRPGPRGGTLFHPLRLALTAREVWPRTESTAAADGRASECLPGSKARGLSGVSTRSLRLGLRLPSARVGRLRAIGTRWQRLRCALAPPVDPGSEFSAFLAAVPSAGTYSAVLHEQPLTYSLR